MNTLVPDVVSVIFDIACNDYRLMVQNAMGFRSISESSVLPAAIRRHTKRKPLITPLTFGQVCRTWRDIANSTPILWDTIWLKYVPGEDDASMYQSAAEHLNMRLNRAGAVPLTIKIDEIFCENGRLGGDGLILYQIFHRRKQWQMLDITCPPEDTILFACLKVCLTRPLTCLEACNIRPGYTRDIMFPVLRQATDLPRLEAPNLKEMFLHRPLQISVSVIGTLTKLALYSIDEAVVVDYLQAAANLKSCIIALDSLGRSEHWSHHWNTPPRIELSYVQEFSLSDSYSFLRLFTLPALEKLSVTAGIETGSPFLDIGRLLHRSRLPSLTFLYISSNSCLVERELIDLLRIVPSLKHLEVKTSDERQGSQEFHTDSHVQLAFLTTLKIIGLARKQGNIERWIPCVNHLLVPELTELVVYTQESPARSQIERLSSMITRSKSKLRKLTMECAGVHNDSLVTFVKELQHLESLYILNGSPEPTMYLIPMNRPNPSDVRVFRHSTSGVLLARLLLPSTSPGSGIYLPKVKELYFQGTLTEEIRVVIEALEYRWRGDKHSGVERLMYVRFIVDDEAFPLNETERIYTLFLEGMDVVFGSVRDT